VQLEMKQHEISHGFSFLARESVRPSKEKDCPKWILKG
jgi:hypothetical protein